MGAHTAFAERHPLLERADLGGADWWRAVAQAGTPLCHRLDDGTMALAFLWRDPMGGAGQSDYRQVYLDVYSHTPHPSERLTSMERVGQSDVWLWQTRLPDDWRGSYFLMPAASGQLPPASPREIRPWWISLMRSSAVADSLNPRAPHLGGAGLPLSSIVLPGAQTHAGWQAPAGVLRGELHTRRWCSERLRNEREVWLYRTPAGGRADDRDVPLVILLDGHHWAHHMPIFGALDALTASGDLPSAVYLLVDALGPEQRARELPCNATFWLALRDELLPKMQLLQPFSIDPRRTLVAGQSFGGLAALYAALHWPQRFGMALSQSGSFWWPEANAGGAVGWLAREVRAGLGAGAQLKLLLEVGCYEADMVKDSRTMHAALQAAGHRAAYREFRGGHDWLCWRDGLLNGMCQLLSESTSDTLKQTNLGKPT